jgi:hypothetical protein
VLIVLISTSLCGCPNFFPHDTQSLLIPRFHRSEIFGFVVGLGTTFAAVPDLLAMLRRRSAAGINPLMPKEEPYLLRNTGKENLDLLVIEIRK